MQVRNCRCQRIDGIVLAVFSIIHLVGCSPQATTRSDVARPVKSMVVSAGEEPHVRTFPGRVEASKRVELAFQVPGLIVKLPVREGQTVAKGDLIAQLRQDEFQARLTALQGQLDQARAGLKSLQVGERPEERLRREAQLRAAEAKLVNARTEFNRFANVARANPNAVARVDYDRAETNYRLAQEEYQSALQVFEKGAMAREEEIEAKEAEVRGLEGRVVEANLQLEDATLNAPYDGVIAKRFVQERQNVRAKEPVVKFQDVDEIDVAVEVPEAVMAADLRSADIVQMVAEFSGAPGLQFPVDIREVAQTADPTTQTFTVRAAMKAPTGVNVLPGMSATVTLTYRRANILGNRILVPISAIFQEPAGEQVAWVIGLDQIVTRRPVKIGEATGGRIEITAGLQPGDRIAVAGVSFLRDGMKVRDLGNALGGGQL
jgi:RND family efflux transporter MFP subunit